MSRFNTGNPLGSGDPRDLDDNAKNMDLAVNAEADTFQDRLGKSRLTWAGIEKAGSGDPAIAVDAAARAEAAASSVEQNAEQIAREAADTVIREIDGQVERAEAEANRAEAASNAAFINADVYPDVASGLAAVANGEQFQVLSEDGLEYRRYRKDSEAVATELGSGFPSPAFVKLLSDEKRMSQIPLDAGLITASGSFLPSSGWRATGFLPVVGGIEYLITARVTGTAHHAWYDAGQSFISSFSQPTDTLSTVSAVAPENARFIRVSTRDTTVDRASIRASTPTYDIDKLRQLLAQHPSETVASRVAYRQETAQSALDRLIAQQQQMVVTQNGLLGEIDLISDESQPFFVPTWEYTKAPYGGSESIGNIVTRNDASTMTLAAGQGAIFTDARQSMVVRDDETGRYLRYGVKTIQGDVIAVNGILPVTISQCAPMHDANLGQHLSRFGYKGLADFLVDRLQKYAYKKPDNLIFAYHPPVCSSPSQNDSSIWNFDNSEMLVEVTRLPGTITGGWVPGSGDALPGGCSTSNTDVGLTDDPQSGYLSRHYIISQGAAGTGMYFSFDAQRAVGFIEIPFSVARRSYSGGSAFTSGRGRLEVLGDGTEVLFDKTYQAGAGLNIEYVDFAGFDQITIRVTCVDSLPTNIRLGGVYAYRKSDKTSTDTFFSEGDVIAFLGDSWMQFPLAAPGEDRPLRPDGTTPEGLQFFPERVRERLAEEGVNVTTYNWSKGGQTSEWGRYWVGKVVEMQPRPSHCVINFGINDNGSRSFYPDNLDSVYDFDPADMWLNKTQTNGGVKGSTDTPRWFENLQYLCRRLSSAGIKPIVMMPAHTSSDAQSTTLRNLQLNKIAAGFSDVNAPRE